MKVTLTTTEATNAAILRGDLDWMHPDDAWQLAASCTPQTADNIRKAADRLGADIRRHYNTAARSAVDSLTVQQIVAERVGVHVDTVIGYWHDNIARYLSGDATAFRTV